MLCDCCGRRKRLFESFVVVKYNRMQINLCAVCSDLAYKIRDDVNEQNSNSYKAHLKEWKKRAKKPSKIFLSWQHELLDTFEKN